MKALWAVLKSWLPVTRRYAEKMATKAHCEAWDKASREYEDEIFKIDQEYIHLADDWSRIKSYRYDGHFVIQVEVSEGVVQLHNESLGNKRATARIIANDIRNKLENATLVEGNW